MKLRTLHELKNGLYRGDCDKTLSYQIGVTLLWMFPVIFFGCILKTTTGFDGAMLLYYAAKTLSAFFDLRHYINTDSFIFYSL